jgi:nucleoside-diphosphate-sugar epimerase
MNKILVTGATGFLGNHVIHSLLKYDIDVVATSVDSDENVKRFNWYNLVEYHSIDLNDNNQDYYKIFGEPDILIHLAWEGLPNYNEPYHLERNVPNSLKLVKRLVKSGLGNVLVAGTCFEYGMTEGCLKEDMIVKPDNNYALAKNILRRQLEDLQNEVSFKLTWPRIFYIYGPGQSSSSLLGQLNKAIESGFDVFNMSPGDQKRDFIPVEEAAGIIAKLSINEKDNGIVNCCSGKPVSVHEFVKSYLKSENYELRLNTGYYDYSKFEPMNFWGDRSKLDSIIL